MIEHRAPRCNFCDTELCLENGVDSYTHIAFKFEAYAIDKNIGIPETMDTLKRQTESYLCPDCFNKFLDKMDELIADKPQLTAGEGQPFVHKEDTKLPPITKEAPRAKRGFKAAEGTQPAEKHHVAPPKDDQEKPQEVI